MPSLPPPTKRRLGELLVDAGLITPAALAEALASATRTDGVRERLGQTLVRLGFATEREVAEALSQQLGLPFLDGEALVPEPSAVALVAPQLARRFRMLPLAIEDGTLVLACADPTDVVSRDDIRMASGMRRVRTVIATVSDLDYAISTTYGFDNRADELIGAIEVDDFVDPDGLGDDPEMGPMIRLVDEIIAEAVDRGASDVHVEPSQRGGVVRYRIDGVLQEATVVPRGATGQFVARLKLMGGMDIAERRLPQDGRARFSRGDAEVDLRISSLPSLYGETMVLRLLRKGAERMGLDEVGFDPEQLARFTGSIERPQGLVLITGPTGSGKTSTLYAGLGHLADETRNIITLEDPVEYELAGINQTHILERVGRTFARCLRTVLRQDPDVVMVGEIRDGETAELALQAAMTGHLVLSTLHTNDAPSAVVRLRELGVPPYLIASSLTLVVAQRLVRKVCRSCAVPSPATERHIAGLHLSPRDVEAGRFLVGTGCSSCGQTGYRGRLGIFELLPVDAHIRDLLMRGATTGEVRRAARDAGMMGLREDGLAKASAGMTTLDELLRVSPGELEVEGDQCPVCAHHVESDFAHCPFCGCALGLPSCGTCARTLEPGWRLCPDCATPVAAVAPVGLPRALIVDDDASVRMALSAMLMGDFEVETAPDAETALELAHRMPPNVALLDVGLPDMDGYALTRELRARPTTRDVPVVLVTGRDDRTTELTGLQAGADDFLTKPVDPKVLLARLEAVLRRGRHRMPAALGTAPSWDIPPPPR
jgi:type II secretory ATPase GspE/PulE/Tfp pilus assembly ATPase PilB-like protein/ActR/RegA family two-component response regulator